MSDPSKDETFNVKTKIGSYFNRKRLVLITISTITIVVISISVCFYLLLNRNDNCNSFGDDQNSNDDGRVIMSCDYSGKLFKCKFWLR